MRWDCQSNVVMLSNHNSCKLRDVEELKHVDAAHLEEISKSHIFYMDKDSNGESITSINCRNTSSLTVDSSNFLRQGNKDTCKDV